MSNALLIIDMLNDFIRPQGGLYVPQSERIVPALRGRLDQARAAGDPVIFICDAHDPDDLEFQRYPPHAVAGTEGARVIDELAPLSTETVVFKKRLGPCYGTNLEEVLASHQVESATVTGVVTHICIMEAVAALCDRDIPSVVPRDCVADFDVEQEAMALKRMQSVFGAKVV